MGSELLAKENGGLSKADCRLLHRLNMGIGAGQLPPRLQLERLLESRLIREGPGGEVFITAHGQLALARWRFRNLPKPRVVVVGNRPRTSIWDKFFS